MFVSLILILFNILPDLQFPKDIGNNLSFAHLEVRDGLVQSSVLAITEDYFGYMWFGTKEGLSRYDGSNFTNFQTFESGQIQELIGEITQLLPDRNGNVWIISSLHGLLFYDLASETVKKIQIDQNDVFGSASSINSFSGDAVIFGTKSGLLYHYDPKDKNHKILEKLVLEKRRVNSIYPFGESDFFVASPNSVFLLSVNPLSAPSISLVADSIPEINSISVYQDELWVGTIDGIYKYSIGQDPKLIGIAKFDVNDKFTIPNNVVRAIMPRDKKGVWVATGDGLAYFDGEKFLRVQQDKLNPKSLNDRYFYDIYFDSKGNFWAGAYFGSVNVSHKTLQGVYHFREDLSGQKLKGRVVKAFLEKGDEIWIGTEDSGVSIWDRKNNSWTLLSDKNRLPNNNIQSLLLDTDGNVWIGHFRGGITKIAANGEFSFINKLSHTTVTSNLVISFLSQDKSGRIWVGTFDQGLFEFMPESKSFIPYKPTSKNMGPVMGMVEVSGNTFFYSGEGLFYFNESENVIKPVKTNNFDRLSIQSAKAFGDRIWIGTIHQGFLSGKIVNGQLEVDKNYFPNQSVKSVVTDARGRVWVSTSQSIHLLDENLGLVKSIHQYHGLENEFNRNSGFISSHGEVFLGGIFGFNLIDPDQLEEIIENEKILISGLYVNFEKIVPNSAQGILYKSTLVTDKIELSYSQNNLVFEFVDLHFSGGNSKKYFYKLEGLHQDWIPVTFGQPITFNNLSFGSYKLNIISESAFISGSTGNTASMEITISPPWWRTYWAYAGFLLLLIYFLYWFRKMNLRNAEKKNDLRIERLERVKQKEIYEAKLGFFTNISHELRTPLTLIIGPLEEYMAQFEEKSQTLTLKIIRKNAYRLLHLVNQILEFRKYDQGKVSLELSTVDLLQLIEGIKDSFYNSLKSKSIDLQIKSIEKSLFLNLDREKMEQVFYNLIANAIRYSPLEGKIIVSVQKNVIKKSGKAKEEVIIFFRDFGKGIEVEDVDKIFTPFYSDPKGSKGFNTGIGLSLAKEIIALHKGQISVSSVVGEGTEFKIVLPVQTPIKKAIDNEVTDFGMYPNLQGNLMPEVFDFQENEPEESDTLELQDTAEKPLVLVVDDKKEVRDFIRESLKKEYEIVTAPNGAKGLQLARDLAPELIVSDIGMPEMDGLTFCKELKTAFATNNIPVILLTVHDSYEKQLEGVEIGADLYLTKPFKAELLREWIKNLLANRQLLTEKIRQEFLMVPSEPVLVSESEVFLAEAKKVVESNISDSEFNVDIMAEQIGVSRTVMYRKFKQIAGISPKDFIRQIRLKRAAQLLKEGSMTISEVTYLVGYNDLRYFRESFQKYFGVKPSQYPTVENKENQQFKNL